MFIKFHTIIWEAFGLNTFSYTTILYMIVRGIIVYLIGITLARFNKKLFGIRTPFNLILFIMLGSIFANAILNANVFIETLCTILLLIIMNGLLTALAYYVPLIEYFIKGSPSTIVKNGEIQWDAMQKNFITKRELFNELHTQLHTNSLKDITEAILASDGTINFITERNATDK